MTGQSDEQTQMLLGNAICCICMQLHVLIQLNVAVFVPTPELPLWLDEGLSSQKPHLNASVGNEAELQSLVRALDPNSKKRNKTRLNGNDSTLHLSTSDITVRHLAHQISFSGKNKRCKNANLFFTQ